MILFKAAFNALFPLSLYPLIHNNYPHHTPVPNSASMHFQHAPQFSHITGITCHLQVPLGVCLSISANPLYLCRSQSANNLILAHKPVPSDALLSRKPSPSPSSCEIKLKPHREQLMRQPSSLSHCYW